MWRWPSPASHSAIICPRAPRPPGSIHSPGLLQEPLPSSPVAPASSTTILPMCFAFANWRKAVWIFSKGYVSVGRGAICRADSMRASRWKCPWSTCSRMLSFRQAPSTFWTVQLHAVSHFRCDTTDWQHPDLQHIHVARAAISAKGIHRVVKPVSGWE